MSSGPLSPNRSNLTAPLAVLLIALCLALAGAARAEDWSAWQRAYDPATRTRFIPVELWTGRGTDMRYVYSPLRGLVDMQRNE